MDINIIKFIDTYGIGGAVLLALFVIASSFVKSKWFSEWLSKFTDKILEWFMRKKTKNIDSDLSESDIINHDIFNYIDFWMQSKIPTLQFSSEFRTIVFRKYISIVLKSYRDTIFKFVSKGEYKEMDQSELWKSLLDLTNIIIHKYEMDCFDSGIPKSIIMKMKTKNSETIGLTIELIENITNSKYYQSEKNFLKMYSILNILLSILESTVGSSERVCDSVSQISGLEIDEGGKTYREP